MPGTQGSGRDAPPPGTTSSPPTAPVPVVPVPERLVRPVELVALRRAFELAARGPAGGPNPQVGAVLLDATTGAVLGEGWHRGAGTAHAEVAALEDAAARGSDVRGATAVVSLEPCDHTGRTGPCSRALLAAGVARVVFSVPDPNPVARGGAERLRGGGVEVVGGVLVDEGRAVLGSWWPTDAHRRPVVTLKLATSLDGRVAAADGTSRWITSAVSRAHAHDLRAQVGAVVVGTGTVLADDPSLTARSADGTLRRRQPLRVVMGHRDVPAGARLHGAGGDLVHVRTHDPAQVLAALAARDVEHVLVEGGPAVAAAFLRAGLVDEVHAYVAPVLLGAGPPAVADLGAGTLADALRLETVAVHHLGPDVLVVAVPRPPDPADRPAAPPAPPVVHEES
ncbi:bifunctional diaminohydroxyphosphoribosylaminopyrimidine deaminase/5-amino-6-(5-phosphoribosylamino)uracil reductase RibD [Cellulomonas endophytica]|uniref:bifunctional diaminohydroxyphosphoribosylaminopyrimidine deaminase/5-amino-6-(5-phosphoribosylamino)uracil reductase RibD n=1 Tax=Cellulomonas endophytica TaxID=2494735 RepID=UPI0010128C54|nr:bifunctional diaminohydroxyphosphoribosylaminopyrimidine deaminase/5-amino-6-(5-phosphoribosylamino)uracil reductase RibD [Cellulomonas endophytica]